LRILVSIAGAIEIMDVRTLNHNKDVTPLDNIDAEETDTDRLNLICEPLLESIKGVCEEIKSKGVRTDTPTPTRHICTHNSRVLTQLACVDQP